MSTKTCSRCNLEKSIKAKGLCNSCYTATCRENAKKTKVKETVEEKEEPNMKELMILFYKQQEENGVLRQKLELLQNAANSIPKEVTLESTTNLLQTPTSIVTLSDAFVQEMQNKVFAYEQDKYKEYFALINKKKKWYGLGEEGLVKLFPCFSLLVEKYKEKMFGKRSKWERDLMKGKRWRARVWLKPKEEW
jgi:hypothetical protein